MLDPWEQDVLRDALGCRPGDVDRWAAREVVILAPRQNGKGVILEVRELAGLFVFGERLILHSAHEFKTARESFLRISSLIENCDDLRKQVKQIRASHGEEGIELKTGQRLNFVARSSGSGRGFTGDVVILDEAYALTDDMMQAMFPTVSARRNPQIWYTSTAGDIRSYVLGRLRERGYEGEEHLYFAEWSAPEGANLDDRSAWEQANPGLGIRISEEAILAERRTLSDAGFARERLGIWPTEATERLIPVELWDAVCHPDVEATKEGARLAVEVTPDHSSAAIAAWGGGVGELVRARRAPRRCRMGRGPRRGTGKEVPVQHRDRRQRSGCVSLGAARGARREGAATRER